MVGYIFGANSNDAINLTTTKYNFPHASNLAAFNTTEVNRSTVVTHAMTIDNLRVVIPTAPGTGKSWAWTIMQNGVATSLTCTIADTNTSAQDLNAGHAVSFAAGDLISIRETPSGTPTSTAGYSYSVRQSASGLFGVFGGAVQNVSNSVVNYNNLMSSASWNATESNVYAPVPTGGTLKNLYIITSAAPGAAKTYKFDLMVNGSPTGPTVSITGAGTTTGNDTSNTAAVVAGDLVSIRCTPTGTPAAAFVKWGFSFAPTTDGESFILYGDSAGPNNASTNWEQPQGRGLDQWGAQEATAALKLDATSIEDMYVKLTTAPGGVASYTFTIMKNTVATAATVPIVGSATTGNVLALNVSIAADDVIDLQAAPVGAPAGTSVKIGVLLYVAPTGALTVNVSDSITVAESITATSGPLFINVSDNITVAETVTSRLVNNINVFDSITIAETVTARLVNNVNVSDSITVAETVTVIEKNLDVNVFDSIQVSENTIPQLVNNVNVSDSITVSETVTIIETNLDINVFDSITVAESIVPQLVSNISVSDNIQLSETIIASEVSNINVSDSVTISENVVVIEKNLIINTFDSIIISESVSAVIPSSGKVRQPYRALINVGF